MKKRFTPVGARILVKEIETTLSVEERARRAGLFAVVESDNRPRPTMGHVIALGTDPILLDCGIKVGDIVHFGPHSGYSTTIEEEEFRMLEWQDITALEQEVEPEPLALEERTAVAGSDRTEPLPERRDTPSPAEEEQTKQPQSEPSSELHPSSVTGGLIRQSG